MATTKQIAANTQNSKHSTGPKTIEGKLVVSQNATRHGLLSKRLIIPGLEQEKEWKAHCQRIMESLAPVGGLETTLAGRIAAHFWRLNRVIRNEAESLRMDQEKAVETVTQKRKYNSSFGGEELPEMAQNPEDAVNWAETARERTRIMTGVLSEKEKVLFNDAEARSAIVFALKFVKTFSSISGQDWPPNRAEFKGWDKGTIKQVLEWMAKKEGKNFNDFLNALVQGIKSDLIQAEKYAVEANRDLEMYRRKHILPSTSELDIISRYEAHLQRAYQRDLETLKMLQAERKRNFRQPPAVIDVDLAPLESK